MFDHTRSKFHEDSDSGGEADDEIVGGNSGQNRHLGRSRRPNTSEYILKGRVSTFYAQDGAAVMKRQRLFYQNPRLVKLIA